MNTKLVLPILLMSTFPACLFGMKKANIQKNENDTYIIYSTVDSKGNYIDARKHKQNGSIKCSSIEAGSLCMPLMAKTQPAGCFYELEAQYISQQEEKSN